MLQLGTRNPHFKVDIRHCQKFDPDTRHSYHLFTGPINIILSVNTICYYTPWRVVSHLSPKIPAAPPRGVRQGSRAINVIPVTGGRYQRQEGDTTCMPLREQYKMR